MPLWRDIVTDVVFADANLLKLWIWIIVRARHTDGAVAMSTGRGTTVVRLSTGQCIVGRKSAANELNWTESTFRNRLKRLEKLQKIVTKPDTHWSLVTVVNYAEIVAVNQTTRTAKRTANEQPKAKQRTQYKKEEKVKKEKNECESDSRTISPTIDEVKAYAKERNSSIDPERFIAKHQAIGWKDSQGNPIVDWHAQFRAWEKSGYAPPTPEKDRQFRHFKEPAILVAMPRIYSKKQTDH